MGKASLMPSAMRKMPPKRSFIIPASDGNGHSGHVHFRCDPAYLRRMGIILAQSKKLPFKTVSDLGRWSLHYGLLFLQEIEPDMPLEMSNLEVINEVTRKQQEKVQYMDSLEKLSRTVNDLITRGALGEAEKTLREVFKHLEGEGYWESWYRGELLKRYRHLLDPDPSDSRSDNPP